MSRLSLFTNIELLISFLNIVKFFRTRSAHLLENSKTDRVQLSKRLRKVNKRETIERAWVRIHRNSKYNSQRQRQNPTRRRIRSQTSSIKHFHSFAAGNRRKWSQHSFKITKKKSTITTKLWPRSRILIRSTSTENISKICWIFPLKVTSTRSTWRPTSKI